MSLLCMVSHTGGHNRSCFGLACLIMVSFSSCTNSLLVHVSAVCRTSTSDVLAFPEDIVGFVV